MFTKTPLSKSQYGLYEECSSCKGETLVPEMQQTDVGYDDLQTIVSLFRRQAKATPNNTAVVYKDKRYTYAEVDEISDRIADYIADKGLGLEDVVSILINRSEWMAIASLGVLKAGCAYQPLDPSYPKERLNFMMQDANAKLLIADEDLYSVANEYKGDVLLTNELIRLPKTGAVHQEPKPETLFILLYTSGSTGVPKGVMLEHRNLVVFCDWYRRYYDLQPTDSVAAYASYGFDACMMDMYPALTTGAAVYIIPEEIRLNLIALNDYFEANHITHAFMTTQVGCQFAEMDNHSLKHLSVGGESFIPVEPPTSFRLHNGYGPTECTIFTTIFPIHQYEKNAPIGKALDALRLYVVNPQGLLMEDGQEGELWISGPQVARGYLNRPEENAKAFTPNPFCEEPNYARVYHTGDIVRRLPDGNLQFIGRRDGQVKIRGFRIEMREVESVIKEFPGIKDVTVQAFDEEGGGKYIAAYLVSDEQIDFEALSRFILERKPPYMVPAAMMQIEAIPLNQNQKVDKRVLPKPEKMRNVGNLEVREPQNDLQRELVEMVGKIVHNTDFGIDTPLRYVGLTSISAIRLAATVYKQYGVTLDAKNVVKEATIQMIEEAIESGKGVAANSQLSALRNAQLDIAPLSFSQTGVYVDCINNPEDTQYNIPWVLGFPADMDTEQLRKAVRTVLEAHKHIFVHFEAKGDDIVQRYAPVEIDIPVTSLTETQLTERKKTFVRPFDLNKDMLCRMEIAKTERGVYLLMDIHHLVFDGSSLDLFIVQLCDVLEGRSVEAEDYTHLNHAADERQESTEAHKAYYDQLLGACEGATELPADLPSPHECKKSAEVYRPIDLAAVEQFCREHPVTPAHLTLAATLLVFARFTGDEDLYISTVSSGRSNIRIQNTFGMFVNTLPFAAKLTNGSVMGFIKDVSERFDEALRHEQYPFASIAADYSYTPELAFAYQLGMVTRYMQNGHEVGIESLESGAPKFKLIVRLEMHDGQPSIVTEYDDGQYSESLAKQLTESIANVLKAFINQPQARLADVSLLSQEQTQLLDSFNDTDVEYDDSQTIVSLFEKQVKATPDKLALVFKDKRFTYAELDNLSDRIASYIASKGLGPEDIVSIIIPRSEWMAIAPLGVLKAGCAFQPLDPSYPKERLNFMMRDSGAKLLIADEALRLIVDEYKGDVLLTKDIANLPIPENSLIAPVTPESLFTLIYTSGSTGVPKGGMTEHRNWVAFCHMHLKNLRITDQSKVAAYASFGFDASPMEIFSALVTGAELHIVPEEIRLDLMALNDYFETNQITHTFMTTQVAYQFATGIENHSLQMLLTGGEKLSSITPPQGFTLVNGYGPSETICYVSSYQVLKKEQNIPIGPAMMNCKLYVVDQQGHRLPVGAAGELWVAGPQVGRGYLNRPDKTAEAFIENPFRAGDNKYARVYKTGDMVRYLGDGNIQFVGRSDGQVKIRGFRIELKEVETVIREFPDIKDATVQAFDEQNGGKFIAAYIVGDKQIDIDALNNFILERKPPYMVPAVTMQIESIPLNQNQKVNKRALPKPEKKVVAAEESKVPMNVLEQNLHNMVAKIVNSTDFGITTVLGYAGLTSISAIKLAIQINKVYGVSLNAKSLVKSGTIQSIENEILQQMLCAPVKKDAATVATAAPLTQARLTYAQMGVYVECMKNPTNTVYNIPVKVEFPCGIDPQKLAEAVKTVIRLHPQLSVHFGTEGSETVQIYEPEQEINIPLKRMSEDKLDLYKKEFVQPFNLRKGPLYRIEIVSTEGLVYLLVDMHHLISDGGSIDIFLNQICDVMNGQELETEDLGYAAFAQAEKENGEEYSAARDYFKEVLGTCEGATEVASDLPNPKELGGIGHVYSRLDMESMNRFCSMNDITPAHLTLAAVFYTLSRFAGSEQICMTTVSSGRSNLRIRNTMGMFVNTLALSACIGKQSVLEFIAETSRNFDETLSHENYPFAQIASDFDISAEIMFAYQMGLINSYQCNGKELKLEQLDLDIPKFRIAFFIQEYRGEPSVYIEYDDGRYSQELMQSVADSVCRAIEAFIREPNKALKQVSLLDSKQTELLDGFNQTDVEYDNTQNIVSLFRHQVEEFPDNIALVYHDLRLTYKQVDEQSERIAQYVKQLGLSGEDVVSVLIPRSEWMVIASLGVLKAGCAYQPLDPSYPADRLNFMMQDAKAKLLIADESLRSMVNEYRGEVLLTKDIAALPAANAPVVADIKPSSLFILLYTSGSTGMPKGCQLEHGNLVAFCHWYKRYYNLKAEDKVAAYASYGFDACMMDMYPALTCGAAVYIIGDDIRLNLPDLNEYFNREGITHSFMTTQVGCQFAMNFDNRSLKHLSVGGEKVLPLNPPTAYQLHNGYGPTECTIFTTTYAMAEYEQNAPIGKPLDNLRLFIVDKDLNRLPLGAAGELLVSGPQVSRGHLNLPEKTAETYIEWNGKRCYRTGDVVRYLPDGNVQFVGRRDGQVKIRGFRIELKEVEAVIREFPGIKDATVQAFDYENGGKYIAAYIVSDRPVDVVELNCFIARQKPPYMVPAATMQIESIPLNQNQKVNRKALPAPVIQAAKHEYVEPRNDQERLFAKIFGEILSLEKVGATDNFFELGGTSLMATRVIIAADKAGVHVAYGDVFANPTPRLLASFILGETTPEDSHTDDELAHFDYSDINDLLKKNTIGTFQRGARQQLGRVLLTGATGYLGMHVLRELIDSDASQIYCMVRGKNQEGAERRLRTLLYYYFNDEFADLFGTRLHVIVGDVTRKIDENLKVDTVFNCAANVKHFSKGTDIEDVNIGGAKNCVDFCLKTGARLVHVSTTSVGGLSVDGSPSPEIKLSEQRLYFGQCLANQYAYSKFMADRIILDAVAKQGLSAKVMRVGNLAARSTDGEFQANFQSNSYMGRIRVFNMLGCCPYSMYDNLAEFSPINETARAIVLLASTPTECTVFHPYNNHTQLFGDVLSALNGITGGVRFVEQEEFDAVLNEAENDPKKAKYMASLLAYKDMAHGKKFVGVDRENDYTSQVLHRLGFYWSSTSWKYDRQMLSAIAGLGFFD